MVHSSRPADVIYYYTHVHRSMQAYPLLTPDVRSTSAAKGTIVTEMPTVRELSSNVPPRLCRPNMIATCLSTILSLTSGGSHPAAGDSQFSQLVEHSCNGYCSRLLHGSAASIVECGHGQRRKLEVMHKVQTVARTDLSRVSLLCNVKRTVDCIAHTQCFLPRPRGFVSDIHVLRNMQARPLLTPAVKSGSKGAIVTGVPTVRSLSSNVRPRSCRPNLIVQQFEHGNVVALRRIASSPRR